MKRYRVVASVLLSVGCFIRTNTYILMQSFILQTRLASHDVFGGGSRTDSLAVFAWVLSAEEKKLSEYFATIVELSPHDMCTYVYTHCQFVNIYYSSKS